MVSFDHRANPGNLLRSLLRDDIRRDKNMKRGKRMGMWTNCRNAFIVVVKPLVLINNRGKRPNRKALENPPWAGMEKGGRREIASGHKLSGGIRSEDPGGALN